MVDSIEVHERITRGVTFSPDSRLLATGGGDQLVKLWKVRDSSAAKVPVLSLQDTFRGHREGIFGLAFSSDGQQLVSAGHDGTARLWPLAVAGPQPVLFDLPPTMVTSFKTSRFLSSQHGLIWTVRRDGAATGWDFRTGRAARSARFPVDWENIRWSGWIPRFDGRLVYAERDRGIAVWDPITARSELLVPGAKAAEAQFLGVVVHQDRVFVVLWGEESQQAEAWMPGAVTPCREPWTRALSSGNNGQRIAQSPDGKHLVRFQTDILPQPDYSPVVTTLGDAPVLRKLVGHRWHIYSCVFSDDSKLVASGSWDATARVWDVASGECVRELRGHLNGVHCQQFTPDGRTLITVGDDSKIRFWHLRTGGEMLVLPGRELILWRPYRSWLLPPNSADGLLMGPTDNQVRFIPVPTLAAIDEEIRRKAAAQP
jgi:WD40 repeat protein